MKCPLCQSPHPELSEEAHHRRFFACGLCGLTFLDPGQLPSAAAERAHYDTHQNHPLDPGYRAFLNRLALPLMERLPPGAEGLDYGAGPGPTLHEMLKENGYPTRVYDPLFAPDTSPLHRTYDFITATEVVEHFFSPREEFDRIDWLLRPGGWLGLMTEMLRADRPLREWRYARDPTHVCFYSPRTMVWIAKRYDWNLISPGQNVALFWKPAAEHPH